MDEQQEVDGVRQEVDGVERVMSPRTSNVWNDLRLEGKLCDVVFKADGVEFKAHKEIMCACTPYFRALFTYADNETPARSVFRIPGVSAEAMGLLIEYAYKCHVEVSWDNVELLLEAADQFSIMVAVEACSDFLARQLSVENAVGIWQITGHYMMPELRQRAYRFILHCFEAVARDSEEFLVLPPEELLGILGEDGLNAPREEAVFQAVLRWVSHDEEERRGHVRMGLLSPEYMVSHVQSNSLVQSVQGCGAMVTEALQVLHALATHGPAVHDLHSPLTRHRLPHTVLLACGGRRHHRATNRIESYDPRADRWVAVAMDSGEAPHAYHGVVALHGSVYHVGGFDGMEFHNRMRCLDLDTWRWHAAASMHERRGYVCVAVVGGGFYAMGGHNGHRRLCSVEHYLPDGNQWTRVASMCKSRSDAGAATLRDKVYICGGFNGTKHLQSAECYDPCFDQWTLIPSMGRPRSGLTAVAYKDRLYVLGGYDGVTCLNSVETYSSGACAWVPAPSMVRPRSNFGAGVLEGLLYVVGGFDGQWTCSSVERYDDGPEVWSSVCDMPLDRSSLSCCVVAGLADMAQYAFPRPPLQ
ncbi:hypothetical protein CRUP_007905 [Coryphaenoides rupestris]|nr:hypothetical protein CRUP_007905 [Coryphaenoides rupestris]